MLPCSARLAEGLGVCKRHEGCEKRAEGEGAEEPGLDERRAQSVCAALARSFEVLSLSETVPAKQTCLGKYLLFPWV